MRVTEMSKETKYANLRGTKRRPCASRSCTAHNIMKTGLIIMMTTIWHFAFLFEANMRKMLLEKSNMYSSSSSATQHRDAYKIYKTMCIREFYRCSWWNMSTLNDCIPSLFSLAFHGKMKIFINYLCTALAVQQNVVGKIVHRQDLPYYKNSRKNEKEEEDAKSRT